MEKRVFEWLFVHSNPIRLYVRIGLALITSFIEIVEKLLSKKDVTLNRLICESIYEQLTGPWTVRFLDCQSHRIRYFDFRPHYCAEVRSIIDIW